jgi:Zn-dependent peptidase ImmA (M78 family)
MENQANRFAGAFLMPRRTFVREIANTTIDYFMSSCRVAHLGVGTKRPVGRNSRTRISTTKEMITACAGLTQIAA